MKPVNNFKGIGESMRGLGTSRKVSGEKAFAKPVFKCARQMKHATTIKVPQIPGVDQLDSREAGSKHIAGPFYTDQLTLLVESAGRARDRAKQGAVFIAPDGDGMTIYRRAKKS